MTHKIGASKQKVLLLNPPSLKTRNYNQSVVAGFKSRVDLIDPPLNLAYVAAYLRKKGISIDILDANALNYTLDKLKNYFIKHKHSIVIMNSVISSVLSDMQIIKFIKKNFDVKAVVFGTVSTSFPSILIKEKTIDFILVGEPEITVFKLVEAIEKNKNLKSVKGLIWRDGGKIIKNSKRELLGNLDVLPLPARDLLPIKKYYQPLAKSNPFTTMRTSRGCINNCLFCGAKTTGQIRWRGRSPRNVADEIQEIVCTYNIKEIWMYDENIFADRNRVIEICKEIIKRKLKFDWVMMGNVNEIDKEILSYLRKAGCYRVDFGIESADEKILKTIRKGISLSQVERAFKISKKAGIQTGALIITGMPGETWYSVKKTLKFLKKIKPNFVIFSVATPYPGTGFYKLARKNRWIIDNNFEKYNLSNYVISYPNFSSEDIKKAQRWSYLYFYLDPSFIFRKILSIKSNKDLRALLLHICHYLKFMKRMYSETR